MSIEWLQYVLGYQGMVDAGVFVLVELLQIALPYVHHDSKMIIG
jgi:hypothetical protein